VRSTAAAEAVAELGSLGIFAPFDFVETCSHRSNLDGQPFLDTFPVFADFALDFLAAFRGREVADEEPRCHTHCESETTAE